jgi:ferredoxin-NADP reductase
VKHKAGQFFEWTLPHAHPDSRGIRRFFTIASSPTEPLIMLCTRITNQPSTFKAALNQLKAGDTITAGHLEGDFTLPRDVKKKLVFIAGGIGITPFRSMIKYLVDKNEKRDIVLFYSNRTESDIAFRELFDEAKKIGLITIYTITDNVPTDWQGKAGFIDQIMIQAEVADYKERIFYISGPEPMVESFEKMIAAMGVADKAIKRDFFPGYTDTHQATKPKSA